MILKCEIWPKGLVLHPKAAKSTERRAAFVWTGTYEAAGGQVSRDLFSEDLFFKNCDIVCGGVLKKAEFVDASMSADGTELTHQMPDNLTAIVPHCPLSKD
jgi:hypothetical protein